MSGHAPIRQLDKSIIVVGGLLALLSVLIGAFAAHGLKAQLPDNALKWVETGARYQMYHALGMILIGVCSWLQPIARKQLEWAGILLGAGVLLFSGSLYILALTSYKLLGAITPVGGILFIAGWTLFIYSIAKIPDEKELC
ncbi:DUF423 domain-containing protein [Aliikangiella sp. G2MR2-5]|uniref:DUF423 domain-containing protein n=1 Tax=Aliikangiella sp. G2MR2-5 TaxID=2788943 RepID=UPI0018AB04AC|nr:DUF423 domain-containing protein [Aliikangiella sp. G2MR2-5]